MEAAEGTGLGGFSVDGASSPEDLLLENARRRDKYASDGGSRVDGIAVKLADRAELSFKERAALGRRFGLPDVGGGGGLLDGREVSRLTRSAVRKMREVCGTVVDECVRGGREGDAGEADV